MATRSKIDWLIIISTLVRCITAFSVELGNDEVYYLSYAQKLQWNYFDHPPMVALLIRLTTFNLHFISEFFVRLGPIILCAVNTRLVFGLTRKIKDEQAAYISALLFTASPYCSCIAGIFILPDSPELFFWIAGLYLIVDIISENAYSKKGNIKMIVFGFVSGICIMSKIHGAFLWVGFGLYIIFYHRGLFKNPYLYLSALICLVIISPIFIWNVENNFITYNYHSARVTMTGNPAVDIESFSKELFGGILYNNPLNYFLYIFSLSTAAKFPPCIQPGLKRVLLFLSLPLILLLLCISLFRDTLPHWSGPAYIPLMIFTACWVSDRLNTNNVFANRFYKLCKMAVALLLTIIISGVLLINYMPGTLGKKSQDELGAGDFTLDMYGWNSLCKEFKTIYETNRMQGKTPTTFLISNKWFPGAHLDNYVAQPLNLDFVAIGDLFDIHHYAWLNKYRKKILPGNDAYFITSSDNYCNPNIHYQDVFEKAEKPILIKLLRNHKPARIFYVYLLKNYRG